MNKILIVDDEKNFPIILSAVLEDEGFETASALSGNQAVEILKNQDVSLVLTDMKMPEMDGMTLLETIKKNYPEIPVIVMTAHGTVEKAVEAMQKGAFTYIIKPFGNSELIQHIKTALSHSEIVKQNKLLKEFVETKFRFGNIIGKSKPMLELFDTIIKIAPTSASVLIEGESGTGKELVAKSIHFNSSQKDKSFIAINCSALAESLLESELFGHEKGSFTGAVSQKKGKIELADGGTLFLDEIGEMSLNLQVKFLRVLQEKTIERVGGNTPIPVNFRLIAATNKTLKKEVKEKRFREDLYFRLNVVRLTIPPLRERKEDINLLAAHFLNKYKDERQTKTCPEEFSSECMEILYNYYWPGNVRELENIIERAVILSAGKTITKKNLPKDFIESASMQMDILKGFEIKDSLGETLAEIEKKIIEDTLKKTEYIQTKAAEILGIGKSGLNQKIKKYNIKIPR
ncbi:MAG: sigma-54 dependent transcriptional regulator [Desulforegulaceae bacterium]|nr:sigma-54 dependent transcriptional regulator [Desulforegulaceae bacterium]